jgi:acetyl esterase/lipase
VVLISPWVSFSSTSESFTTNKRSDVFSEKAGAKSAEAFLGYEEKRGDNYTGPLNAERGWWEGLMVEKVCVVMGLDEMMLGGLREFVERFNDGFGERGVSVLELKGTCHVSVNIEPMFGYGRGGDGEGGGGVGERTVVRRRRGFVDLLN